MNNTPLASLVWGTVRVSPTEVVEVKNLVLSPTVALRVFGAEDAILSDLRLSPAEARKLAALLVNAALVADADLAATREVALAQAAVAPVLADSDDMVPPVDRNALFHARINQWTDALEAHFNAANPTSTHGISFRCDEPGRKFCRIVQADANGKARSVHAFYDMRTGDVYKAEGWAKPAKHIRYNLLDDASFAAMIEACDWSGGYLYLKR